MAWLNASARPSFGSVLSRSKVDIASRVAASELTAQCDTGSARAPA
jgi:hypothetical protein